MDNRDELIEKAIVKVMELLETDPKRLFEAIREIDAMGQSPVIGHLCALKSTYREII